MNTSGHETESVASGESTTTSPSAPNLQGLTIFVYVVSILMGLAAGLFLASIKFYESKGLEWDVPITYVSLGAGVIAGVVAAWFWMKLMTSFIRDHHTRLIKIPFLGILWGMVAGWLGAGCFWFVLGIVSFSYAMTMGTFALPDFPVILLIVAIGVGIFGTIGGLGAGVICGVAWAIWTRSRK